MLNPDLAASLALTAQAMAPAVEDWWVIGSAAAALHGAATGTISDIDVVLSVGDAERILPRLGLLPGAGAHDPVFNSEIFAVWYRPALAVEFMAGLSISRGGLWRPLKPKTRQMFDCLDASIPVPDVEELKAILRSFGRPKDYARITALEALS